MGNEKVIGRTNRPDFMLQKAADTIWPKAVLTRSSVVLGLARIGAESVLKTKRK
jgi:hypothetical protein